MFRMDAFNHSAHGMQRGMGFNPMMMHNGKLISAIMAGLLVYMITCWIFRSIGLYQMAKKRDIFHAWFAWIPFLSDYVLGELIDGKVIFGDSIEINDAEVYLPLLSLMTFAVSFFGMGNIIGQLLILAVLIFKAGALWRLFKLYQPQSRATYTILSFIFGSGFFIFALRNEKPAEKFESHKLYPNLSNQNLAFENIYGDGIEDIKSEAEKEHTNYGEKVYSENSSEKEKETLHNEYANDMDDIISNLSVEPYETKLNYSENEVTKQEVNDLENQLENALEEINEEIK